MSGALSLTSSQLAPVSTGAITSRHYFFEKLITITI